MNDPVHGADAPSGHRLALRFTGSGSEYFRIWIVNLLLTFVTLSLYYPFAKVRRLRYFHTNTHVGEHALGFHADPRKMLRGYLLVGLLFTLYWAAGKLSEAAGLAAFVIVAAIWPALTHSSLRFRLANTSWRGLRFRFTGTLGDAYRTMLPMFVPGLLLIASVAFAAGGEPQRPAWSGWLSAGVLPATLLAVPWFWRRLKVYQHGHCAFGPLQTRLEAGNGAFYALFLKAAGLMLLASLVTGAVVAGLASGGVLGHLADLGPRARRDPNVIGVLGALLVLGVGLLALQAVTRPYLTARLQNLVWSRTTAAGLRIESRLRVMPLIGLTLKNWALMLVTLGLYWPFAAVATARMRLEAVEVDLAADPQSLVDEALANEVEAAGDAAGDLFGLDVGL